MSEKKSIEIGTSVVLQVCGEDSQYRMASVGVASYELVEAGVGEETKVDVSEVEKPQARAAVASKTITLEWKSIHYAVNMKDPTTKAASQKVILHSMSGKALPGEILGIMGSSGAGKSTLLDVLACRLESSALFGNVLTNGSLVDKRSFRKETGYVMQNDALFPMLTVRETIRFAAYLRIPGLSRQEKNEVADKTISLLRLDECADTIVGDNDNRGISGGQKRRVSIAVDIVHEPAVIFLDEPTSGLDSSTALSVVESLKQLCAKKSCTVVMTIHQPSARLFSLLDKVMFLSRGRVTYFGPSSETHNAVVGIYAEAKLGNAPNGNPPELFLDVTDQLEAEGRQELVTDKYREIETVQSTLIASGEEANLGKEVPVVIDSYANSLVGDSLILMERALLNIVRTKEHFFARLGTCFYRY